jgi:hypothetical protein
MSEDVQTRRGKLIVRLVRGCSEAGITLTVRYCPIAGRRFRFDAAIPSSKIAIEILDNHMDATALMMRCEKVTLAALQGWAVVSITPRHIRNGAAVQWIGELVKMRAVLGD